MYRLKERFGDQIEFIDLNIDDGSTYAMRAQYNIVDRTRYVLVDINGEAVHRWFGPLDEQQVVSILEDYLAGG